MVERQGECRGVATSNISGMVWRRWNVATSNISGMVWLYYLLITYACPP